MTAAQLLSTISIWCVGRLYTRYVLVSCRDGRFVHNYHPIALGVSDKALRICATITRVLGPNFVDQCRPQQSRSYTVGRIITERVLVWGSVKMRRNIRRPLIERRQNDIPECVRINGQTKNPSIHIRRREFVDN